MEIVTLRQMHSLIYQDNLSSIRQVIHALQCVLSQKNYVILTLLKKHAPGHTHTFGPLGVKVMRLDNKFQF